MFADVEKIIAHCEQKANAVEGNGKSPLKWYKVFEACAEKEAQAEDLWWWEEQELKAKLNDKYAKAINWENFHGNKELAKTASIDRMKKENVGGVGDIYTAGEDASEALEKGDYQSAAMITGAAALRNIGPQKVIIDGVETVTDAIEDPSSLLGGKKKKHTKKDKNKGRDGLKINGIQNCGKVMTYCKAKSQTFSKRGDNIQYDADHIPAKGYMVKKAELAIKDGNYKKERIKKINPCIEQAIVCNALTVVLPKPIHILGRTYGKTSEELAEMGDFKQSASEVADKDMEIYENVLKKEDAIKDEYPTNKHGKKLTKSDKEKLKKSNDKCEGQIKKGLEKLKRAFKKESPDDFLDKQIRANAKCDKSTKFDASNPSCPKAKCIE